MAEGETSAALRRAPGARPIGPHSYARPVGEADEGDGRTQPEAVEDVLSPEGGPVALRRGPDLCAPARLTDDVGRVEAVALRQRQEPLKAGGVQEVAARQEDRGRGALVSDRDHVGVAEARADGQALFTDAQPGERLVVERLDLGLALGRPVDGSGQRASPPDTPARPVSVAGPLDHVHPWRRELLTLAVATRDPLFRQRRSRYVSPTSWLGLFCAVRRYKLSRSGEGLGCRGVAVGRAPPFVTIMGRSRPKVGRR